MKTKLELAHEYAMLHMDDKYIELTVDRAWQYADSMYAELEKRQDTSRPDVLNDFEVDWSQAPSWAEWWEINKNGKGAWCCKVLGGVGFISAPSFNYQGNWRDSLRKRP